MIIDNILLPPPIKQRFSSDLLSVPAHLFRDCCKTFDQMWKEAEKLWKKIIKNPEKYARCEELKAQIMELYERAKVKEKEREGQEDHQTQGFGYSVTVPSRLARDLYWRLRFRSKGGAPASMWGMHHKVSTIRGHE